MLNAVLIQTCCLYEDKWSFFGFFTAMRAISPKLAKRRHKVGVYAPPGVSQKPAVVAAGEGTNDRGKPNV